VATNPPPDDSVDLIYEHAVREFAALERDWQSADQRAQVLLGFVGVVFSAALVLGGTLAQVSDQRTGLLIRILVVVAIAALGVSGLASFWSYQARQFVRPGPIGTLWDVYRSEPTARTKVQLVRAFRYAQEVNVPVLEEKLRFFRLGLGAFGVSSASLALAIVARAAT
jgi:hypothetical protein